MRITKDFFEEKASSIFIKGVGITLLLLIGCLLNLATTLCISLTVVAIRFFWDRGLARAADFLNHYDEENKSVKGTTIPISVTPEFQKILDESTAVKKAFERGELTEKEFWELEELLKNC